MEIAKKRTHIEGDMRYEIPDLKQLNYAASKYDDQESYLNLAFSFRVF